ncbi:MAG: methenyltetrahydromethanopterin cyclohydrolase [Sedimenticola thiotaurini]|uniref:Methenyltetrahydromethanopterin cyclohydrolase n=1 Tax=Sedimenticola thiotaurini TaxID=1543721 RepID=A0A558D8M1_9GAMM|nr:MAG: methenyltetrahydromethanopterin cyclohydrolase [Sedimenticola thiotaurini]
MAQLTSTGSLNRDTLRLVDALIADAASLRLVAQRLDNGVLVVDAGIACQGSLEAGRRIAEICMGGQGHVALQAAGTVSGWSTNITVHSNNPVIACLGSQYAGWSLSHGEGKQAFHALGSGPGRILARKEKLYEHLELNDNAGCATLVLEVDKLPPLALTEKIASDCGVAPEQLRLILTPTCSLAGSTQVVARVLEVALHKAHELGFSLIDIVDGMATAPLPPPAPDFLQAMGRTNDAILFAGQVHLFVSGDDAAAEALADSLPSSSSKDYGRPFAEVFKAYEYDFFKIDPMLFSPARTLVSNINTGRSFTSGQIDQQLLLDSFGVTL